MKIIGYIHICQKKGWVKSLKLLLDSLYKSELYEATKIIRIGIVNDDGHIIDHKILHDNNDGCTYQIIQGIYQLKTLSLFSKCSSLSNNLEIYMKEKFPLLIKYMIANLGYVYLILSSVSDKNENDYNEMDDNSDDDISDQDITDN